MTTAQHNNNIFFSAMDREVSDDTNPETLGWNNAKEHTMYGMSCTINSNIQGALTALYAGLVRGATKTRIQELYRNVKTSSKDIGDNGYKNAMAACFVIAFQKRDCRGGEGEKDVSRWLMLELWNDFPKSVQALAPLFPEYGYWKDYTLYIQDLYTDPSTVLSINSQSRKFKNKTHPFAQTLYQLMIDQLHDDIEVYNKYQLQINGLSHEQKKKFPKPTLSLLAKWFPKEGRSFDKKFRATKVLARIYNPELYQENKFRALGQLRKHVSMLNEVISTTERLMSLNRWDEIEYRLVPGKCLQKHRRAFLNLVGGSKCKTQEERSSNPNRRACRQKLLDYMELAVQGKVSIKGKTLHIHEIVHKFGISNYGRNNLSPEEKLLLELQWKTKRDDLKKMIEEENLDINQFVIMSDFSASMQGTPINVAMAFGIMLSEVMQGPYANRVLSFAENPAWIVFSQDMNLEQKIKHALAASWGGSTNFLKAHDLILAVAIKHKLNPNQMPKGFLCVSDMQFNTANRGNTYNNHFDVLNQYANMENLRNAFTENKKDIYGSNINHQTIHEVLVETYHNVGNKVCGLPYTMGRSIYWNVQGNTAGFPVQSDTPHTQLVAGFAIEMIKLVFQGKYAMDNKPPPTPWQLLVDILAQDRYHTIFQHIENTAEGIFHDFKSPTTKVDSDDDDIVVVSTPETLHAELQTITADMSTLVKKTDPDSKAKIISIQNRITFIMKALADPSNY